VSSEPGPTPDKPLTSWKEIAAFFGRNVRTVQRWEKEEGLPIHRHLHHRQSSVYAYPGELGEWWRKRAPDASEQPGPRQ
jgi:phage terminase Nu1 subunit (DNA packaging protein)